MLDACIAWKSNLGLLTEFLTQCLCSLYLYEFFPLQGIMKSMSYHRKDCFDQPPHGGGR